MARRSGHDRPALAAALSLACSGCAGASSPPSEPATPASTVAPARPAEDRAAGSELRCTTSSGPAGQALSLLTPDWSGTKPTLSLRGAHLFAGPATVAPRQGGRPELPPGAVARIGGGPGVGKAWKLSPDAAFFVGPSAAGPMALYEGESRKRVALIETGLDEATLSNAKIGFLASKQSFALFSKDDRPARLRIYSTTDGHRVATHPLPTGVRDLFFDAAGRRAALLFAEPTGQPVRVAIVDVASGAIAEHTLPLDPAEGRVAALSGDGARLVVASPVDQRRSKVDLVELNTGKRRWHGEGLSGGALSFSPDDKWIAESHYGATRIVSAATGVLAYRRDGQLVAFTPEGRAVIEFMGCLTERDFAGGPLVRFDGPENDTPRHGVVTASGKLVVATSMLPELYWWERSTGRLILVPTARMHGVGLAFSQDGRELIGSDGEYLHRWNVGTGMPIDRRRRSNTLLASEDGQRLLASQGQEALERAERAGVQATALAENRSLQLSRDGSRLLVTTIGGSASDVVIDLRTGGVRPIKLLGGNVSVSPDGELLAQWQNPVRIVRSATGEVVREIPLKPEVEVAFGEFSPDGKWIALLAQEAPALWLTPVDGSSPPQIVPAGENVTTIAFSPNGRWLAVGHEDGTADLRAPQTGQLHRQFTGHRGGIYGLVFSANGSRMASVSEDGTALIWRVR